MVVDLSRYADDPNDDRMETSYTTYEGEWLRGKHHGAGTKEWGDGITVSERTRE